MAKNTPLSLRNQIVYSVYVRNHGETGTFTDVEKDLDRIADLGTDIIWFMPIHPIGVEAKKGSLGCPYAIQDYRKVNPEYGTLDDFKSLVDAIHSKGMTCMIDVVYNHTSPDSVLATNHPDYFLKDETGKLKGKVAEWSDVVDFDFSKRPVWDELIDTLIQWVKLGVDGFRCDVASLVPLNFWLEAREKVAQVNPNVIWLAESVEPNFIVELAEMGYKAHGDIEVFQAFDMLYDYDVWKIFKAYRNKKAKLQDYLEAMVNQHKTMPGNYVKLKNLENHDNDRAKKHFTSEKELNMWTAFQFSQLGPAMIYAGQEAQDDHTPSLFERDPVNWSGMDPSFVDYLKKLVSLKRLDIMTDSDYSIEVSDQAIIKLKHQKGDQLLYGVFNVEMLTGDTPVSIPDGNYLDFISGDQVRVAKGKLTLEDQPRILVANLK